MSDPVVRGKVLVVSADIAAARALCAVLTSSGYACSTAPAQEAEARCMAQAYECMVVDATIGVHAAVALGKRLILTPHHRPPHVIMWSVDAEQSFRDEVDAGVFNGVINKPADLYSLVAAIVRCMKS